MVQLRVTVTAIPEVAIHWSSSFSGFRYRLDAGFRRRETIEYLKRQRIDFSGEIARFAAILKEGECSSRSGPVRSLPTDAPVPGSPTALELAEADGCVRKCRLRPWSSWGIRLSVSGSSQRGRVCARPDTAVGVWGVGRERGENSGQGRWRPPRFPEC